VKKGSLIKIKQNLFISIEKSSTESRVKNFTRLRDERRRNFDNELTFPLYRLSWPNCVVIRRPSLWNETRQPFETFRRSIKTGHVLMSKKSTSTPILITALFINQRIAISRGSQFRESRRRVIIPVAFWVQRLIAKSHVASQPLAKSWLSGEIRRNVRNLFDSLSLSV
jgi:hypothetical protein